MDIKPLLDLTCAKVASMIKGKTPEEIRKTFNIVNDFTPEEEAQSACSGVWWGRRCWWMGRRRGGRSVVCVAGGSTLLLTPLRAVREENKWVEEA